MEFLKLLSPYTIAICFVSFCISVVLFTRLIYRRKKWDEPPVCLTDPANGTHGFLKLKNIKIHYVEKGNNTNPLMLFLHGFPEFWYSWKIQMNEFSKDYWTVAVDMRGYGDSDKPKGRKNYTMDLLVEDIKEIVEALGRDKCILIAHDWGGVIGWYFVNRHPEMVERYVMMNAPHFPTFAKVLRKNPLQFLKSWYAILFHLPIVPEFTFSIFIIKSFRKLFMGKTKKSLPHLTSMDIDAFRYTFRKPGRFTGPMNYYRTNMICIFKKEQLSDHNIPGLIIFGENDDFLVAETATLPLKYIKNLEVRILKDASHFLHHYDPDAVNRYISEFLQDIK